MPVIQDIRKTRVPVKIFTDDIEPQAFQQLLNIANLPIVHGHVAAMPDVHLGKGATVGSVIPTRQAIIPAAVGVDIGCGMNAVRLSLKAHQLPDNLRHLRGALEQQPRSGLQAIGRRTGSHSGTASGDRPHDEEHRQDLGVPDGFARWRQSLHRAVSG
jgi:RNA-splicing ligase RtcB